MQWLTAIAALVALPLTAVSALWPVIRDRGRIAKLERVAQIADIATLSEPERRLLTAYRRRLTRQVFVRTMLRRRWFDLISGLYGAISMPVFVVAAIIMFSAGDERADEAWLAVVSAVTALALAAGAFDRRRRKMRQQARLLLSLYRSPVSFAGANALDRLVRLRGSLGPSSEVVEQRVRRFDP